MFDQSAIQQLAKAEAISAAASAVNVQADSLVALPDDFKLHDLEQYLTTRRRERGTMNTSSVSDFAAYAKKHAANAGSAAFVDQDRMCAIAVLNLGSPVAPGHADNKAVLKPKMTAAYSALVAVTDGKALSQQRAAEFMEDWTTEIECFVVNGEESSALSRPKAIAAIRKVTIESLSKLEATAQNLSASRSTFEQVQAASGPDPLPTRIYFTCVPYQGLESRLFVLRLGIRTDSKDPIITLRVQNKEKHEEEMAAELAQLVRDAIGDGMPVMVGTYAAAA